MNGAKCITFHGNSANHPKTFISQSTSISTEAGKGSCSPLIFVKPQSELIRCIGVFVDLRYHPYLFITNYHYFALWKYPNDHIFCQIRLTRSLYIVLLLLLFIGWCFICVQWYVCGIKGLCGEAQVSAIATKPPKIEDIAPTGNMAFEYKSAAMLTDSSTSNTLDSLRTAIKPGDMLQLTGYYWGTEDSSLANQRLATLSHLLEESNVDLPRQMITSFNTREDTLSPYRAFDWALSQNEVSQVPEAFSVRESDKGVVIQFPFASADPSLDKQLRIALTSKISSALDIDSPITVVGHTDNTGSLEVNQQLGQRRAEAIANLLIQLGIAQERLTIQSLGSRQPIATNDTEEGRTSNRRVEIKM